MCIRDRFTTVYNHISEGVKKGCINEEDLDAAVLRTLQFREEMGLLDNPYVDPQKAQEVYDDPKADKLSEEIAQKAITLLKNDGILPLKNTYKKIAVIGPFANKLSSFFGGYEMCIRDRILMSVLMPLMMQALSANAAAYAQGGIEALTFYPVSLFGAMALCGGTGNTLPLAIFGLKAKSEQIRAVSKIALVPGWFGINEPMTFGMPIMYNPILCIPYVLAILVVMLCTLIGYQTGWLIPAFVPIMTLMPMGFAQFFGTLRWQNAIWDYLMLIPAGIVWYPFFKVYDNQLYKKEQETKAAENQA